MSVIISQTQRPTQDGLYAKNTVPQIEIDATEAVSVQLKFWNYGDNPQWNDADVVFEGSYAPDFNGEIWLDFSSLYDTWVKTSIPTSGSTEVVQSAAIGYFKLFLNGATSGNIQSNLTWYVCNAKLKSATAFETWAQANFLTNQPLEKTTNYEAPEWLTYLDLAEKGNRIVIGRFYPKEGGMVDCIVKDDEGAGCFSVNVNYSRLIPMVARLPHQLKGYYDIILTDGELNEICRQRYIYAERSGREKYFLFVNALGGIDTLICDGANTLQPETTHNIGRFGKRYVALDDTDDVRQWNQETGMVPYRQRSWIHELLTAKQGAEKYDPELEIYQAIVVTSSEISMSDNGQLASGTFGYMLNETVNVIADNERPDRSLHQSVADQAEELHDGTQQVVLAFADDGNGGYETEDAEITATKLYVEFDDSITDARTIPVYYYLGGSSTAAGSFTPGTDTSPVVITKAASASIRFASQSNALGSLAVSYYPTTVIID